MEVTNDLIRYFDMFAGIGGFRAGLTRAGGFQCVGHCEIDKYADASYRAIHDIGEEEVYYPDATKIDPGTMPGFDLLCAGFPCQPFSIAGVSKKQSLGRATGFEDKTQGTLFFDICRILKAKRPKAFMLENVKNLKSHDRGRTFKVITEALEELDYEVFHAVLDGQNYVPQHRERVLIVGFDRKRYGRNPGFRFDITSVEPKPVMKDILETEVDDKYTLTDKLWTYLQNYAAKHRAAGNGFGYGIADPEGIARTLSARYYKDGSEILIAQDGMNPRRLTPRECARLQGFPEKFEIVVSHSEIRRQTGNSVAVPMIREVAKKIVELL